jgi:hypothetical protein
VGTGACCFSDWLRKSRESPEAGAATNSKRRTGGACRREGRLAALRVPWVGGCGSDSA